jgi:hypothetical protein
VLRRVPPDEACGGAPGFSVWGSTKEAFEVRETDEPNLQQTSTGRNGKTENAKGGTFPEYC